MALSATRRAALLAGPASLGGDLDHRFHAVHLRVAQVAFDLMAVGKGADRRHLSVAEAAGHQMLSILGESESLAAILVTREPCLRNNIS